MRRRPSYDYQEPTPRGGWLEPDNTPGRRFAERGFSIGGAVLAVAIALGCLFLITNPQTGPRDAASAVLLTVGTFAASAFAYFVMRGLGVILTSVSWLAFFSDLRLKAVWMSLLEACVFFAAAGLMAYSLLDAVNHGSTYSAVVFAIIALMSFWPLIRHRLRHRCWP